MIITDVPIHKFASNVSHVDIDCIPLNIFFIDKLEIRVIYLYDCVRQSEPTIIL